MVGTVYIMLFKVYIKKEYQIPRVFC